MQRRLRFGLRQLGQAIVKDSQFVCYVLKFFDDAAGVIGRRNVGLHCHVIYCAVMQSEFASSVVAGTRGVRRRSGHVVDSRWL